MSAPSETGARYELSSTPDGFDRGHPRIRHLGRCLILLLMAYVVYSNSFKSGWVLDSKFITQLDSRIKQATSENLKLIWEKDYWWPTANTGAYRPLVSTTYLWSFLDAYQGFMKIARSSQRPEMLSEAHNAAVNRYHFDPKAFAEATNEKVSRPLPPSPVFHVYGKKLSWLK